MRAIQFSDYGPPQVLTAVTMPEPQPGAGQVRVAVRAAGVNAIDGKLRSGAMREMRPLQLPHILGSEVAGTVTAVGDGVDDVRVGDAVLGWTDTGGYADAALLSTYVPKPATLSWPDAASLPVAGEAAQRTLATLAPRRGETLLIHGGAGSVGLIATQLAVRAGVTVIATASPANHDFLRNLGAVPTTYGEGLADRVRQLAPDGVDAVLSAAGQGALPDSISLRGGTDRIVTIADLAAFELNVPFLAGTRADQTRDKLDRLVAAIDDGTLVLPDPRRYALGDAVTAHLELDRAHGRGKIILEP